MKRRKFLKNVLVGTAGVATGIAIIESDNHVFDVKRIKAQIQRLRASVDPATNRGIITVFGTGYNPDVITNHHWKIEMNKNSSFNLINYE